MIQIILCWMWEMDQSRMSNKASCYKNWKNDDAICWVGKLGGFSLPRLYKQCVDDEHLLSYWDSRIFLVAMQRMPTWSVLNKTPKTQGLNGLTWARMLHTCGCSVAAGGRVYSSNLFWEEENTGRLYMDSFRLHLFLFSILIHLQILTLSW